MRWSTNNSIGYPDFFDEDDNLAGLFRTLVRASNQGLTYDQAKELFEISSHQVETKKAAFEEFGLLFVARRSNVITVTPLGRTIHALCSTPAKALENRDKILYLLCRGLSKYTFKRPGNPDLTTRNSDVYPYLATYYLTSRLGWAIAENELRGSIMGIESMAQVEACESDLRIHRESRTAFADLPELAAEDPGTVANRLIYFSAHLGLANALIEAVDDDIYNAGGRLYRVKENARGIVQSVLHELWVPGSRSFGNPGDYYLGWAGHVDDPELVTSIEQHNWFEVVPPDRVMVQGEEEIQWSTADAISDMSPQPGDYVVLFTGTEQVSSGIWSVVSLAREHGTTSFRAKIIVRFLKPLVLAAIQGETSLSEQLRHYISESMLQQ